jgi:hypothetical protein
VPVPLEPFEPLEPLAEPLWVPEPVPLDPELFPEVPLEPLPAPLMLWFDPVGELPELQAKAAPTMIPHQPRCKCRIA